MTSIDSHIAAVPLEKAYRLLNHGPSILVSARHAGVDNVMAAAWACALDFSPPKLTVVLDKATRTRALVEGSGTFVIQVPTAAQLQLTHAVSTRSPINWRAPACGCFRWRGLSCRSWPGVPPGWLAGCCPSRITSRRMICSSAK